ncbi:hypothetical protein AURDEDRAFT_126510 [Auricularia subglabra TFB-10046 SS5]|nr:hypothetical protein AURDEDRAFT_126510 [Auricularia subglabra TFB-10046 SS5]
MAIVARTLPSLMASGTFTASSPTPCPLHPILRLPDELLAAVFLEWLDSSSRPFWGTHIKSFSVALHAAGVCRWWRSVALATPALWRVVDIDLGRVKSQRRGKNIRWTEYAKTCLSRAGAVPLELSLAGLLSVLDGDKPAGLAIAKCLHQTRRLVVEVGFSDCSDGNPFVRYLSGEAPIIEYVWVGFAYFSEHRIQRPITFFTSAPRLREMHGRTPCPIIVPSRDSVFPSVELLTFKVQRIELSLLIACLGHSPNLRTLAAGHVVVSDEDTHDSLAITHKLERLILRMSQVPNSNVLQGIHLPSLRVAHLDVDIRPADTITSLLQYTVSSVEDLTLCCGADVALLPGLSSLHRLRRLVLHGYRDSAEQLFDALAESAICPALEELSLTWRIPRDSVRLALQRLANARGPRGRVHPSLKTIHIDYRLADGACAHTTRICDPEFHALQQEFNGHIGPSS